MIDFELVELKGCKRSSSENKIAIKYEEIMSFPAPFSFTVCSTTRISYNKLETERCQAQRNKTCKIHEETIEKIDIDSK